MGSRYISKKGKKMNGLRMLPQKALSTVTAIYVFLVLGIYPLIFNPRTYKTVEIINEKEVSTTHHDIGYGQYMFFRNSAFVIFPILIILFFIYFISDKSKLAFKELLKKISLLDYFVFAYLMVALISYSMSDYKDIALFGQYGWYMGIVSQIGFVLIYFFVSRFWKWDILAIGFYCVTSSIVFIIGIFHRFSIDLIGLFDILQKSDYILFLSTIGQATWYSGYLCSVYPIGVFFFWFCKSKAARIFSGIYCFITFSTLVTQNSDSAFISLAFVIMLFFWFSVDSNEKWKHFWELVIIILASFRFMGILQDIFTENAVKLESLSVFASHNVFMLLALLISVLIYVRTLHMEKVGKLDIIKYIALRKIMLIAFVVAVIGMIVFIVLNTYGLLGKTFGGYLFFDEFWGNNRGFTWSYSVSIFKEFPLVNKLFGIGPDSFAPYSLEYHADYLASKWGNRILQNAHNEWLNSFLCYGIFGAVAYIGIFITAIRRYVRLGVKKPFLIAIAACLLSYMGHNLFCYQVYICTPIIFILLGIGEYIARNDVFKDKVACLGNMKK